MLEIPPFSELCHLLSIGTNRQVEEALFMDRPDLAHLAALLSPAADPYLEQMAARSAEITRKRFGRTIQIYAPLYLSNYCINICTYCGFSAANTISRRLLSIAEAGAEAELLHRRGFNHILLVSGESPKILGVEYLSELVSCLKERFAAISIEVQPLGTKEYEQLFVAGVTGVAIYQETYDRTVYEQVHRAGPKQDYDYRLYTPDRAAIAGVREVGIGSLLGLSDWRAEGLAIGHHLVSLRKKHWQTGLTVSFPRLRPAKGGFKALLPVSERDLSQLIFALRIFDPDVGLTLSTREESRFRDGMIGLGPTRYSAGSCTSPGGYSEPERSGEQFAIGDHRSLLEVFNAIRAKGFDPVRKDWDPAFQVTTQVDSL